MISVDPDDMDKVRALAKKYATNSFWRAYYRSLSSFSYHQWLTLNDDDSHSLDDFNIDDWLSDGQQSMIVDENLERGYDLEHMINMGGPAILPGEWKVSICTNDIGRSSQYTGSLGCCGGKSGHCWIQYEDPTTGKKYTIDRMDEEGLPEWGMNYSLNRPITEQRSVYLVHPRIYKYVGGPKGLLYAFDNCCDYSLRTWQKLTGEDLLRPIRQNPIGIIPDVIDPTCASMLIGWANEMNPTHAHPSRELEDELRKK
jgi:hypothetical protein